MATKKKATTKRKSVKAARDSKGNVVTRKSARKSTKKATRKTRAASAPKEAIGKRAQVVEAAKAGKIPPAPDFSAPSHARWRKKLDELVGMVKAGDVKGLKKLDIPTYSSSPRAMAKYRDLAVIALQAKGA